MNHNGILPAFRLELRQVLAAPHKLMNLLDMSSEVLIALNAVPLPDAARHTGRGMQLNKKLQSHFHAEGPVP